MSKIYIGHRQERTCFIWVHTGEDAYKLVHFPLHSPTGLEWGYGGSGPADTAFSILMDYFGEVSLSADEWRNGECEARKYHQRFKWDLIAHQSRDTLHITEGEIDRWLQWLENNK